MGEGRLLLVDDEAEFVDALAMRLEAKGYEVAKAYNGEEALEKARSSKPDLILLDVMMPGMGGYDVCRKLKIDKTLKDVPILMLTAKFEPNDIEFGKEMGTDAYMTKPVELDPLLHKVQALLRAREKKHKRDLKQGGSI